LRQNPAAKLFSPLRRIFQQTQLVLVLLGIEASPVHNGGAYGDGTTESGVGFGYRAAQTTGRLSELTFSSGWTGATGQDYFAERFRKDQPGSCGTASDDPALIQEQLADARAERRRQRTGRVASLSDAVLRTSVGRGNREGSMLGSKDSKAQDRECGMMSR